MAGANWKRFFAIFLASVFFYSTTPREFLHDVFADHSDTVDHPLPKGDFAISDMHVHCAFMHMHIAPYVFGQKGSLSNNELVYSLFIRKISQGIFKLAIPLHSLRAPPSTSSI